MRNIVVVNEVYPLPSIPLSLFPSLPSFPLSLSLSVFPFFRFLTLTYLFVPVSLIPCFSFLCLISFLCFCLFFSLYIVSFLLIRRSLRVIRMSMSIVLLIGQTVEQLNGCHEKSTLFEFMLFILSLFSCFFVIFRLPTSLLHIPSTLPFLPLLPFSYPSVQRLIYVGASTLTDPCFASKFRGSTN